jgi:hypothetical protein
VAFDMKHFLPFLKKQYAQLINTISAKQLLSGINEVSDSSDTLYVFSAKESRFYTDIFILLAYELSKQESQSIFLFKHTLVDKHLEAFSIDEKKISSSLKVKERKLSIVSDNNFENRFKRNISPLKELVEINNINFFPVITCTLRAVYKRYNIDWENEIVNRDLLKIIDTCELLLNYFLLLQNYSVKTKKKVRIIGCEANYVPNSVFHYLCRLMSDDRDIEFIDFGRGYMHYFGHHFRDSYLTAINTTYENVDSRHAITEREFKKFKNQKISQSHFASLEKGLLRIKSVSTNMKKQQALDKILQYRKEGRPVFVLFAHVFFDVAIEDQSPSFKDMCSWIVATIEYFRNKDWLLVLKPHPAEIRKDHHRKEPAERLASFIKGIPRTSNIMLLEPDLLTLKELREYISVGLIWKSTVAMELACYKVPVIIAGVPNYKILNFLYSKNRSHYFNCIENYKGITVGDELKSDALRYIYYLEKNKNNYFDCFKYNINYNYYYWDRKALRNYLKHGNNEIETLVSKITV